MVEFNVGVVLPASGAGERFGASPPKQYTEVLGKPLFVYALEGFLSIRYVKKICLVIDNVEKAANIVRESGVHDTQKILFIAGGSSRHRSIKLGLQELQKHQEDSEIKVVVIHDGVRPMVPADLVTWLVMAAESGGAAGSTRPLVSTVLKPSLTNHTILEGSLDRRQYCASETPQAFRFDVIYSAYVKEF